MITSSLLQSLRIACSITVFHNVGVIKMSTVPTQQLPQCNRLQRNNLNCIVLREIEHTAVTVECYKRDLYEFLRILKIS